MPSNSVFIRENFGASLKLIGMKKQSIENDGNCFFRAISDQLWGHQEKHAELRKETTDYLRAHPQDFIPWIVAGSNEGGEYRRSASRAAKKAVSKESACFNSISQEETDRIAIATYKQYVDKMSLDGTWAGEHEMLALANARKINIIIYSKKSRTDKELSEVTVTCKTQHALTKTANIIRHEYNHFSSARPIRLQSVEWSGLKSQTRDGPKKRGMSTISNPTFAPVIFTPRAATFEIRGTMQIPGFQPKLPFTKLNGTHSSLQTPPYTPENNKNLIPMSITTSSSAGAIKSTNKNFTASKIFASKSTSSKPTISKSITSRLSSPAGICKTKTKPKTDISTGESRYKYPNEKTPMTRTAMRMKCGFLGRDEAKLFKLVEKKEDGTPKVYPGGQKISIVKGSA